MEYKRVFESLYPEYTMLLASVITVNDLIVTIENTFVPERIGEYILDFTKPKDNKILTDIVTACLWARKVIEDSEDDLKSNYDYDIASKKVSYYPVRETIEQAIIDGVSNKKPELIEIKTLFNIIVHSEFIRFTFSLIPGSPSSLILANYESDKKKVSWRHRKIQITVDELVEALRISCLSESLVVHILLDRAMRYIKDYPLGWNEADKDLGQHSPLLVLWCLVRNDINSNKETQKLLRQYCEIHTDKNLEIEDIKVSPEGLELTVPSVTLSIEIEGLDKEIQVPAQQIIETIRRQHPLALT